MSREPLDRADGEPSAPTALFAANRAFGLVRSRLQLMQRLQEKGWRVVAAAAPDAYASELDTIGVRLDAVPFGRGAWTPGNDWRAYARMKGLMRQLRPQLVCLFNAKPVILGGWAARGFPQTVIVNTITGLGHAFIATRLVRWAAVLGYRLALAHSRMTIFQNPADLAAFRRLGLVREDRSCFLPGSGVDVSRFRPQDTPRHGPLRALMVSRLLGEKGVREFADAARICRSRMPDVRFELAGEADASHPDAVPVSWIEARQADGDLQYLGYVQDMESLLPAVAVLALPSYREGMPRVLLEAAACGVPVVATDVPGCQDAVEHGKTGLLVPPKDAEALAHAMLELLEDPERRTRMGCAARARAEERFSQDKIAEQQIEIFRDAGLGEWL